MRYAGWQRQENGITIQGEIESVLSQMFQEHVNVVGAGRTDAGVHARGQVANVKTETTLDCFQILGGLKGLLPEDIVVHEVVDVPLDFHARYSAKERTYSYSLTTKPTALKRLYAWQVRYRLDVPAMQSCAESIVGEHDFTSFSKAGSDVDHYRCTVNRSQWQNEEDFIIFTISADRFLYGMVRALVGTMVDVGRGYSSKKDFLDIFNGKNRAEAGMAAPARGLVLENIVY